MQEESTYHKTIKAFEAAFKHHTDKNVTEDSKNSGIMWTEVQNTLQACCGSQDNLLW